MEKFALMLLKFYNHTSPYRIQMTELCSTLFHHTQLLTHAEIRYIQNTAKYISPCCRHKTLKL